MQKRDASPKRPERQFETSIRIAFNRHGKVESQEFAFENGKIPPAALTRYLNEIAKQRTATLAKRKEFLDHVEQNKKRDWADFESHTEKERLALAARHERLLAEDQQTLETKIAKDRARLASQIQEKDDYCEAQHKEELDFLAHKERTLTNFGNITAEPRPPRKVHVLVDDAEPEDQVALALTTPVREKNPRRSSRQRKQTTRFAEDDNNKGEEDLDGQHIDELLQEDFSNLVRLNADLLRDGSQEALLALYKKSDFFRRATQRYLAWAWTCGQQSKRQNFSMEQFEILISLAGTEDVPYPDVSELEPENQGTCFACRLPRRLSHVYVLRSSNEARPEQKRLGPDCAGKLILALNFIYLFKKLVEEVRKGEYVPKVIAKKAWPIFRSCFLKIEKLQELIPAKQK